MKPIFNGILAAALAVVGSGGAVMAQDDLIYSNYATDSCMSGSEPTVTFAICIGRSANACMEANSIGGSTLGMTGCLTKEHDYWDARLNASYRDSIRDAKEQDRFNADVNINLASVEEALREMQRAWIKYRDARCGYTYSQWGGGTGGGPAYVSCLMESTAEQVFLLEQSM